MPILKYFFILHQVIGKFILKKESWAFHQPLVTFKVWRTTNYRSWNPGSVSLPAARGEWSEAVRAGTVMSYVGKGSFNPRIVKVRQVRVALAVNQGR